MISAGRIPMTEAEAAALEQLLAEHDSEQVTLTRRDPGDTGPLLVQLANGETITIEEA